MTVRVYSGATVSGSPLQTLDAARSGGSWTIDAQPALADGVYTAQATQTNTGGAVGTSTASTFTIDTAAPQPTLTQPAPGSTVTTSRPQFGGSAGSATGDSATLTVEVYAGSSISGSPEQTLQASRSGATWSVTPTATRQRHAHRARQADRHCRERRLQPIQHLHRRRGRAAAVGDAHGAGDREHRQRRDAHLLRGRRQRIGRLAHRDRSHLQRDHHLGCSAADPRRNTIRGRVDDRREPALADGTYTAQASQINTSGGAAGTSAPSTFTVDTAAPQPTLAQPTPGRRHHRPTQFGGAAPARRPVTAPRSRSRSIAGSTVSGAPEQTLQAAHRSGVMWSITPTADLGNGAHTARARQSDAAGNAAYSAPSTFTVSVTAPPPSTYRTTVLADTPRGYWRLGEASGTSASDETGTSAGVYTGGVTLGQAGAVTATRTRRRAWTASTTRSAFRTLRP